MAPWASSAAIIASPSQLNDSKTSPPSRREVRVAEKPSAKKISSPSLRRLPGRARASHRQSPCRSTRFTSTSTSRLAPSRAGRMPFRAAGRTRVSLKTSTSPGLRYAGRSRTEASTRRPSPWTTSRRAASWGSAGRRAIRSSGRSNWNWERSMRVHRGNRRWSPIPR